MLNTNDLKEINETINVIEHIREDLPESKLVPHLTFVEYLEIAAFILLTSKELFFRSNGKPKSFLELVGSIGRIITFVRDLVRMVNRDTAKKAAKRKAREANGHIDVIEAKDKNNPGQ